MTTSSRHSTANSLLLQLTDEGYRVSVADGRLSILGPPLTAERDALIANLKPEMVEVLEERRQYRKTQSPLPRCGTCGNPLLFPETRQLGTCLGCLPLDRFDAVVKPIANRRRWERLRRS